jgi:hypothetical protein
MNWCWTLTGIALTGAMTVLSAFINYSFGYSLGTTELSARIFGAVSVVAVGMMALLPLRSATHWEAGRKGRAVLGAGMFGILVAYAVAGSIGFGMQNRSQLAGSKETLNAQLSDLIADRDQATSRQGCGNRCVAWRDPWRLQEDGLGLRQSIRGDIK